jgi:hypothetical protein
MDLVQNCSSTADDQTGWQQRIDLAPRTRQDIRAIALIADLALYKRSRRANQRRIANRKLALDGEQSLRLLHEARDRLQ